MGRFADLPDEQLLALTPRHPDAFGTFFVRATGDAEQALDLTAEVFAAALVSRLAFDDEEIDRALEMLDATGRTTSPRWPSCRRKSATPSAHA